MAKFLFSATMQPAIEEVLKTVMDDPVKIQIGLRNSTAQTVKQELIYVGKDDAKIPSLRQRILEKGFEPPMLIFVQSKVRAKELHRELKYDGMNVECIHGDCKKSDRDEIIKKFRVG
jgi:ATP-dependent RNA helicase DDX52/ROK1